MKVRNCFAFFSPELLDWTFNMRKILLCKFQSFCRQIQKPEKKQQIYKEFYIYLKWFKKALKCQAEKKSEDVISNN